MHYQKLYPHKTVIAQEKMDEWSFLNPYKTVIAQAQFQEKMDECELVRMMNDFLTLTSPTVYIGCKTDGRALECAAWRTESVLKKKMNAHNIIHVSKKKIKQK